MDTHALSEISAFAAKHPDAAMLVTVVGLVGTKAMAAAVYEAVGSIFGRNELDNSTTARIKCPRCKKIDAFELLKAGKELQSRGASVRKAYPDLAPERHKQLITDLCPSCQLLEKEPT